MKNRSKLASAGMFFLGVMALLSSLFTYTSAIFYIYSGRENYFLIDWAPVLTILLVVMFVVGWWVAYLFEYLVQVKGRKTALIVLAVAAVIWVSLCVIVSPLIIHLNNFIALGIIAALCISGSGFGFRTSVAQFRMTVEPGRQG